MIIRTSDPLSSLMNSMAREFKKKEVEIVKEFAVARDDFKKGDRLSLSSLREKDITPANITMWKRKYEPLRHVRTDGYIGSMFFDKNRLVGFVNMRISDRCIQSLEVTEPYRGREIGTQLFQYAVIRLGAKMLSVNKKNEVAIRLYKKFRFVITDQDDTMYYMERGR